MFLHLSVILLNGGVSAQVYAGIYTPRTRGRYPPGPEAETPLTRGRHTPQVRHPRVRHPTGSDIPQSPPWEMATAADGMHPTGMHSCYFLLLEV